MMTGIAEALEGVFEQRGYDDVWWGLRILDCWPHIVGKRYAESTRPFLEKSPLRERGLLTVAVKSSAWMQELSFLNIRDRLNRELGRALIRTVRFEVRQELP